MKKTIIYILLILMVGLSACQKNIDEFVADPATGADIWYNNLTNTMPVNTIKNDLLLPVIIDSIDIDPGLITSLLTTSGLKCDFFPGSIVSGANVPVTGKIVIETHLLKNKGDMIRMGTPTISNDRLLVSGGAFFIRLTKDGNELKLAPEKSFYISYADQAPSSLMKIFVKDQNSPVNFNWLPTTDTLNRVTALSQTYNIITDRLNWINCDYFYDTSGIGRTIVSAGLPENFTNANTVAFTVFNDLRSVVGMYGTAVTRKFSSGYLPVNKSITVVIISKQGNDYYLGHSQAMSASQTNTTDVQVVNVVPVLTSFDNITAYLNSL